MSLWWLLIFCLGLLVIFCFYNVIALVLAYLDLFSLCAQSKWLTCQCVESSLGLPILICKYNAQEVSENKPLPSGPPHMVVQIVGCTTCIILHSSPLLQSSVGTCAPIFHICRSKLTEEEGHIKESEEILWFFFHIWSKINNLLCIFNFHTVHYGIIHFFLAEKKI